MSQRGGAPEYTLKGLLTMRRGDLDSSRAEITKARDVLERAAEEVSQTGKTIAEIEVELRSLCETGATIDPSRHAALSGFLKDRQQVMQKQKAMLQYAEQLYEQARNRLHRVKQGVMVLEKHKETKEQEFKTDASRREQKLMDDMWLQHPRKN